MRKIYVSLLGGFGNQLYQVAFGYMLMRILKNQICFDISKFRNYKDHKIIVDKLFPEFSFLNLKKSLLMSKVNESTISFDEFLVQRIIRKSNFKDVKVNGYFQSLSYFSNYLPDFKELLIKRIEMSYPIIKEINIKNKLKNTLGIHIRRGNKTKNSNIKIYGLRSLEEKIKNINNVLSKYNYESILICGDDSDYLENLKTNLKFNGDIFLANDILKNSGEILDFYFLTSVRDLMITNSTYSLWAGYLKNSGIIFFPKPFYPYPLHKSISRHNLEDIIFPNWIPYKVNYE